MLPCRIRESYAQHLLNPNQPQEGPEPKEMPEPLSQREREKKEREVIRDRLENSITRHFKVI